MPACHCGGCIAEREGRLDEYLRWIASGEPCDHPVTRRVRTLGHPIKGVRDCAKCYKVLQEPWEDRPVLRLVREGDAS